MKMTAPPPPPPPPPVQEAGALNASVERILAAWVSSHNPPGPLPPLERPRAGGQPTGSRPA